MTATPAALTWSGVTARRMARHALAEPATDLGPAAVAGLLCGAHAQVLSAAEFSIGRRIAGATRADVQRALWQERSLVKTFGPRGPVHLLPATDLPMWTGALSALPSPVPAAHCGVLCFGPDRSRRVTYTNPHRWLPGFRPADGDTALRTLVARYLHAYGPATPAHFAKWIGVAVIAGPAALSPGSGTRTVAGEALVLLATLAFGGYTVVLRPLSEKYGPVSATATSSVAGALPYLALAGTVRPPRLSQPAWAELIFLALGSTVAGMLLWNRGIVRGGSARISRLLYLEPVVSVLGAMVFLGERATAAVLAGGVLVIAGVLITGDWMARQRRTAVTAGAAPPR
jgi:uncharacterized membrane protein